MRVSVLVLFTLLDVFSTGSEGRCSVGVGGADIAYAGLLKVLVFVFVLIVRLDRLVAAAEVEVVALLLALVLVLAVEGRNKLRMASFFATCTAVLPL